MSEELKRELRQYLQEKNIKKILVDATRYLLESRPENAIGHIAQYLVLQFPLETRSIKNLFVDTNVDPYPPTKSSLDGVCMRKDSQVTSSDDSYSEEDEDNDDVLYEIPKAEPPIQYLRSRRSSVSAETLDPRKAKLYEGTIYPKSPAERSRIREIVAENILFMSLDEKQMNIVLDAMFPKEYDPGDVIIHQGDDGDNFYILESGVCEVYKDKELVQTCTEAMSFGELALMYNAPRAATVIAKEKSKAWALDRNTFKFILMDTTLTTRKTHKAFIDNVPLLDSLNDNERTIVADALKAEQYKDGQVIIRQGDKGNHFYIIEDGTAICSKQSAVDAPVEIMGALTSGAYFGEIALLTSRPRQATVTAKGDVKCLILDRKTFKRVMGPLEVILKRNMDNYNLVMANTI